VEHVLHVLLFYYALQLLIVFNFVQIKSSSEISDEKQPLNDSSSELLL